MRERTEEVARLAEENGYRLQREHPNSGGFWLWGSLFTEVPIVVGSLETIEAFFALTEMHRLRMEANASFAMKHGLEALARVHGRSAIADLSLPVKEASAFYDEQVREGTNTIPSPPPWRVEGDAVEGYFVYAYWSKSRPALYGPYATLEDAQAVVAAEDPTVRHLSRELWARQRREEDLPPPPSD